MGAPTFRSSVWIVCLFSQAGFTRHHYSTDAHWTGASSWPWISGTVQHLHLGIQKLRHDNIQVNGFSLRWFYYYFLRKCESVPWVRKGAKEAWGSDADEPHILCPLPRSLSHSLTPLPRRRSPARGQAVIPTVPPKQHKEMPWIRRDLRSLQHLCWGDLAAGIMNLRGALLWCKEGLDSLGKCWAPGSTTELFIKHRVCLNRKLSLGAAWEYLPGAEFLLLQTCMWLGSARARVSLRSQARRRPGESSKVWWCRGCFGGCDAANLSSSGVCATRKLGQLRCQQTLGSDTSRYLWRRADAGPAAWRGVLLPAIASESPSRCLSS